MNSFNGLVIWLTCCALCPVPGQLSAADEQDRRASFERHVLPLLERRCNRCHNSNESQGGLDLTRVETMLRGGEALGAAIVPGRPSASPLVRVLTSDQEPRMPEEGEPLTAAEIEVLRRWISEGARDDTPTFSSDDVAFFEREIRPLLFERCLKCHAGEEPESKLRLTSRHGLLVGGSRGPAVNLDQPEDSPLLKALRHDGELKMPNGGDRLTDAQIALVSQWIRRGLPWPKDQRVLARKRLFSISEADRSHWSFRPLPKVLPTGWSIDTVLRAHHGSRNLTPAALADRHRLLRRVTYDLIGYPPTPDEVAAFVNDRSPDAFQDVVARLLDSPHFGWRWGRHWLDYSRNGSTGQPTRGPALDSQRYAAWVAQCFNADRPWNWFARVHIAGDLMPAYDGADYDIDQALAAAVPLNGPRTFSRAETETFVLMDKLDEGIEFMGRSLMGVSLECARCHDHKFDPVSQRDYYGLLGFFQSSGYAPVPVAAQSRNQAVSSVADWREQVREKARLHGFIRRQGLLLNVGGGGRVKQWQATRPAILAPIHRRLHKLEIEVLRAELAAARNTGAHQLAADLRTAIADREAALQAAAASGAEDPGYNVSTFKEMGYFISGHKSQLGLIKRAAMYDRDDLVRELEQQARYWEEERQRWGERSTFGGYARTDPEAAELARAADRIATIKAHLPANPDQPWVVPERSHLYVRTDGGLRREEDLKPFDAQAKAAGLQFNSDNANRVFLHPPFIGDARLLVRGDVLDPAEIVPRGTPEFFGASPQNLDGSGRLQLAEWLTAPESIQAALVARTAVNRAWQHLFGEALCRTPKELGRLGETPELPELIDGLAVRFIDSGWSVKSLIHEIVVSDAYRRSAAVSEDPLNQSRDNLWFSRQNVRRLEYEPIANTMAWLATGERFSSPRERDAALPSAAEYATHFDGPANTELLDRRVASITATQALFLMNHPASARGLAARLLDRLGPEADARAVFEAILQRPPTPRVLSLAEQFSSLEEFAAALICSNETIYLE